MTPTTLLLACGPSLTKADVDFAVARSAHVIAVNNAAFLAPKADVLYACDAGWWKGYENETLDFEGERWTQLPADPGDVAHLTKQRAAVEAYGLKYARGAHKAGLSLEPGLIHYGGSSAYQALNLAVLFGAKRVVLLGLDCKGNGRDHFFGEHPSSVHTDHAYASWIAAFESTVPDLARAGVEVLNASRETALTCFPRVPLEEAFEPSMRYTVNDGPIESMEMLGGL